ncbi:CRISPR-associated protein [archaeon BMS3Bbin15]|nr:CRISPR-associated protein [archaeon BMS3Bbin15]
MKTALIAPIGTSAPVITEMAQYLNGMEGLFLTDMVIIPTQNEYVKAHTSLAKEALRSKYPKMRIHIRPLPFEDINSTEDNIEFMRMVARVISEERSEYKCEKVYLSIAGGRKDVCTSLAIVGQLIGADGVFHVIYPSLGNINIGLERIKDKILELHYAPSNQREEIYLKYRELFDTVMFPPIEELNYIHIPCIPYPREYMGKLVAILLSKSMPLDKTGILQQDLKRLERAGIVTLLKDRVVATEFGSMVGGIWR